MRWPEIPSAEADPTTDEAMKIKELRDKETPALAHELTDKQKHLFALRSQAVTEKLEDPTQLSKTRRDIAQIRTILRERELEAAKSAATTAAAPAAGSETAP